jgi:hypothetical protein
MRFLSPVTHAEVVWVLVNEFGFRVVRDEGLQTELRRGRIHVVVRTYKETGDTVIRFHEDRYRMGERHTVERSARLLKFEAELREALSKRGRAGGGTEAPIPTVEAPSPEGKCKFYGDCRMARADSLLCMSGAYSGLCEEYKRLEEEERRKRNKKI